MPVNVQWPWRDGAGVVEYNGRKIMFGGWNLSVFPGGGSTNEVWESLDNGLNWTQLSNAPWSPRHSFGYCVRGGKIWLWGGDYLSGVYQKDVWTFDDVNGWVEVTSDWGSIAGDRILFAPWGDENYIYMFGGQTDYTGAASFFTDGVRSVDGITWESFTTLPLTYFSTGAVVKLNGIFYLLGGGRYLTGSNDNFNYNIYALQSGTWNNIGTVPILGTMYCNATVIGGYIFLLSGAEGETNRQGLYYCSDPTSWYKYHIQPPARHAAGITGQGDSTNNFYIISGNGVNDVIRITKNVL